MPPFARLGFKATAMRAGRMCYLAQVRRAGFYRALAEKKPAKEDLEVRAAIQKIAIEHGRRYGYRRITAELRRQGMQVNRKRVGRIC